MKLQVGDRVCVRDAHEILATLDVNGRLDGLPFMPQMLVFCGRTFRVSKSAHKLCDTVHGTGARRMDSAVFLEDLRCDGRAYGGCEMECLIFWKTAWLRPVGHDEVEAASRHNDESFSRLEALIAGNVTRPHRPGSAPTYCCQATQMPAATASMSVWDLRQYVEDVRSGNARPREILGALFFLFYDTIASSGLGIGSFMRWVYDRVQSLRGRWPYPSRPGKLARGVRTPSVTLGLCEGELVKVRTQAEVLATVTEDLINRGMGFHPEMVPYCGKSFRVRRRLTRIMNEKTGELMELKNQCLVLEGASCIGRFTKPLLCPRGMWPYWREIWLERVESRSTR